MQEERKRENDGRRQGHARPVFMPFASLNNAAANAAGSEQAMVVTGTLQCDGTIFKVEMIDFKITAISLR